MSCLLANIDSDAGKCLPHEPKKDIDDTKIATCFKSDDSTIKAKQEYINHMEFLHKEGTAYKIFQKHLRGQKPDPIALDSEQQAKYNFTKLNDITVRDCAWESLQMAEAVDQKKSMDDKYVAYMKWTTCMRLNFCFRQVQNCLAKQHQVNSSDVFNKANALDVMECVNSAVDPEVNACVDTMEDIMNSQS